MSFSRSRVSVFDVLAAATAIALLIFFPQIALAQGRTGDVYVLTNQSSGNSVMVFHRGTDGTLTFVSSFATGGNGAGSGADPLGSQGSLVLSEDHRLLFAVNAGSNSISAFGVSGDKLTLLDTISSGGTRPVSLTVRENLVYAVNAGGTPNISGFSIESATNHLVPLAGSTQNLPGGASAGPAQVSFSPDGSVLVVTEKGTNLIDAFTVNENGVAQPGVSFPSNGGTPFGFVFGHDNIAIVSDAAESALTSYKVSDGGEVDLITPALTNGGRAACWAAAPRNGRFAFSANSGSKTISSYTVSEDGSLALLNAVAATTNVPLDMAFTADSRFFYVRNADGTVTGFRLEADGSITPVANASGLPAGSQGIAAR
ncbi:MAG TPA: beta-propeller fold lactonase family protein [Candidatus Bathyarchaeia archaeon]|jgi:6-phosphogluconolactonase (cycloisomerase 2 family)|nr:beta-propeller fold lactonase family protein [Candidatus Bathyarchaeia archaeon]